MSEKVKVREAEKSPLTLSFNSKEENLLRRRLLGLEALKRQAADSRALEQKVVYGRFQLRLRRSELAHARLMEDRELARRLSGILFSGSSGAGSGGGESSQEAMKRLLQSGRRNNRVASAPCQPRAAPHDQEEECEEGPCAASPEPEDVRHPDSAVPSDSAARQPEKAVHFDASDASSVNRQAPGRWAVSLRPHTTSATVGKKMRGSSEARRSASALPLFTRVLPRPEPDIKGEVPPEPSRPPRPSSRSLFLNTGDAQRVQKLSLAQAHATRTREADFESKVQLFVRLVKGLQQQDTKLRDYYSSRLVTDAGRKDIGRRSLDNEDEQQRWRLLGQEPQHRSITIRRLDTDFSRKDIPQDVLLMESYNAVLTEENRAVRNWPGNDPYHHTEVLH